MSESLLDLINQQNKEINPSPYLNKAETKKPIKPNKIIAIQLGANSAITILKSYQQMKKFKYQKRWNTNLNAQNLQKPQMLYCIKKTQNLNKKIEEHNLKVKKERE